MFERYLTPKSTTRRWRRTSIAISVAAHVGVGTWLILSALWNVERLSPSRSALVDLGVRGGPEVGSEAGGGAPPPPLKRKAASKPKRTRLDETVQPVANATPPDEPGESGEGDEDGDENGSKDGVKGGQGKGPGQGGIGIAPPGTGCIGECVGTRGTPPPPPPPCRGDECGPKIVPAKFIDGYRITGNAKIGAPDTVRVAMSNAGKSETRASIKMCLDTDGRVTELTAIQSSGYEAYDAKLLAEMRAWRYRPYEVNGERVAVCTVVTFIYRMQ